MSNKTSNNKVSNKHVSVPRRDETIKQVKLRVTLLNDFLENGVPEGFDAHILQKEFLAYSDGKEIISRTRPAVADKYCSVSDIDPKYQGDSSKIVNCLTYLQQKREEVIVKQNQSPNDIAESETDDANKSKNKSRSKSKTKRELNQVIKEQSDLIKSLARELILQRSANNKLISLFKETDQRHQMTLKPYYANHQDELCKSRKNTSSSLSDIICTLNEIAEELDDSLAKESDNVISMRGK